MKGGNGWTQKFSIKHFYTLELTLTDDYHPLSPGSGNLNSIKTTVQPSLRPKRKMISRKRKKPADDQHILQKSKQIKINE